MCGAPNPAAAGTQGRGKGQRDRETRGRQRAARAEVRGGTRREWGIERPKGSKRRGRGEGGAEKMEGE